MGLALSHSFMKITSEPIYVLVEQGQVTDIQNIPPDKMIQVIDKDIDGEDEQKLSISPIDGEACIIMTFAPHGHLPH